MSNRTITPPTVGQADGKAFGVAILGSGMCLPPNTLTNQELAKRVETNDEWITQRTGIKSRYIADKDSSVRDLAVTAAKNALADAKLQPTDIDFLILATLTPEMVCPSTAARVVLELGAVPAGAVDISAACSGFVYGLNMASALVRSGFYRRIMVVGAEKLSDITDWSDRRTCILFGDGAGAAVIGRVEDATRGCLFQHMHSDATMWGELYVPRGEKDLPEKHPEFSGKFNTLQMNGREVYKFAVSTLQSNIDRTLGACGLKPSDLAMIVSHQSNGRILESAREKLGLPEDKIYINIDRFGNTSAASVAICLHELRAAGRIKQNDLVLFTAMGGGMTWTSSLWRM
ncbi:MAG: beta-ketoacyl-ACP synthase III [Phycisphaera sp.]|nr:beta-ketoacyl-ACP synthase III [Phycisphaera sp.]